MGVTKVTRSVPTDTRIPDITLIECVGMGFLQRHRWFVAAAGVTLAFAAVSLSARPSLGLTFFSDLAGFALMLAGVWAALSNVAHRRGQERSFWTLVAVGFALWTC